MVYSYGRALLTCSVTLLRHGLSAMTTSTYSDAMVQIQWRDVL